MNYKNIERIKLIAEEIRTEKDKYDKGLIKEVDVDKYQNKILDCIMAEGYSRNQAVFLLLNIYKIEGNFDALIGLLSILKGLKQIK